MVRAAWSSQQASRKFWPPTANSAASVLPMVPVPMMATVLSEIATVVHLS